MIKLERMKRPSELTEDVVSKLTEEYKKDNRKVVWRQPYITKTLLIQSHYKCSYCEVKLGEEGKYMQVDHYHSKSKYPDEVICWENLIPSCNRCNTKKSIHDTYTEPIINPYVDDPRTYIYMENYRLKARDNNKMGQDTIDVLYLNDTEGLVLPRFKIGDVVQKKIDGVNALLIQYFENQTVKERNRITSIVKDLLRAAKVDSEFSALVATVMMQDEQYMKVRKNMKENDLWDEEMEEMHNNALKIALLR